MTVSEDFASASTIADQIIAAKADPVSLMERLLKTKTLSGTVRKLNWLLTTREHDKAVKALAVLGFIHA